MSHSLEFEGENVETAVKRASTQLKISEQELKFKILSKGSKSIFGFGTKKNAKILVDPQGKKKETTKEVLDRITREFTEQTNITFNGDSRDLQKNRENRDNQKRQTTKTKGKVNEGFEANASAIELGKNVLVKIVNFITHDAEINTHKNNDRVEFRIQGGNAGMLIGKRGKTLEAIQSLVEKVINKHSKERIRIQIDIEGYLKSRKQKLEKQAEKMARKVKKTGKPLTFGQMNAHDRRIVHISLKGDRNVRTKSIGDGYLRKLIIFPKNSQNSKNRKQHQEKQP